MRPLLRYIGWRFVLAIPQVMLITVVIFFAMRALPADPVARIIGNNARPAAYEQARRSLGLDQPVYDQFRTYVSQLAEWDLGRSWVTGDPISDEVIERFPVTIQLIVLSFSLALLVAIPLGIVSAVWSGGRVDRSIFGYGLFAGAQPDFWWGIMFIFLFVYTLGWFPAPLGLSPTAGSISGFSILDSLLRADWTRLSTILNYYALPSLTLAFVLSGPIIKMIRQNMIAVLESDFILHARASGLHGLRVGRDALLPAVAPVLTLVGILFGFMLGGSVLIETIFSIDGLAHYAVDRTLQLDYPAVQAVVLIMTGFSLTVYLAMDVAYAVIDPRLRR